MNYTITKGKNKKAWLNHAYLKSLSFGSKDMAWTTTNEAEANEMLRKVKRLHRNAKIEEIY